MIASVRGRVEAFSSGWAVVNVNGIGLQVYVPTPTLASIASIGKEVQLYTHLQLREDGATLYGFASPEELSLFQTLLSVSGIGPKLAMAMLSAMNANELATAIATGNMDMLTSVPGIGKKIASRIILELKEKVGAAWISAPATRLAQENTEVISALTALGYSASEATRAVSTLPADSTLTLEEKVKLALQYFGK
jgi:Holliday junction DNA helicase RuvA